MTALDRLTRSTSELAHLLPSGKLECVACAHRCRLAEGRRGVCRVRVRDGGELLVPWGYTAGVALDPVEKKPFFHVMPGSLALSFGMLGCDMKCSFCQNWLTSQTLRDPRATTNARETTPEDLVATALATRAGSVVSTYNEPLITAEWAHAIFEQAGSNGLLTGCVSNGHATPEVFAYLQPVLDLIKIDLKSMREQQYRKLGGRLPAVLDSIERAHRLGLWVEVVTLIVPGFNDDPGELRDAARFVASVSPDVPWHVTAFHPDYNMTDRTGTPASTLATAWEIGRSEGLNFVYAGNLPGVIPGGEDTQCPNCGSTVVSRRGFRVVDCRLGNDGRCRGCGAAVPGVWTNPSSQGGAG